MSLKKFSKARQITGLTRFFKLILLLLVSLQTIAQRDSIIQRVTDFPEKYISKVSDKVDEVDKKLSKQTLRLLKKFENEEARLLKILGRKDSTQSNDVLTYSAQRIEQLQDEFVNMPDKAITKFKGAYNAYIDTLKTSFKFLQEKGETLVGKSKVVTDKLKEATSKINVLDGKLQKSEEIKKYLRERKDYLRQQLEKYGMVKELRKIEKVTYYYGEYIKEYKEILSDRKKLECKAMALLYSTPIFKKFVSENSLLAGLFKLPGSSAGNNADLPSLAGIQTRANVTNLMQESIAPGGPNAITLVKQQIQTGQAALSLLKDKIAKYGSADTDIPSFKPNSQKTKSFLKRLEYGANVQFGKSNQFMPTTSDIAVSLGYKINDKSSAGIGVSYKMGLGTGWDNIQLTSQGIGLRGYIDWKIKGNFFLSGGYEQNYNSQFKYISQLNQYASWQSTGLIGLSKKLKLKGGKSTKISVMYDFLSNTHIPVTQPFVFRTGFNLK